MLKNRNASLYEALRLFAIDMLHIMASGLQSGATMQVSHEYSWQYDEEGGFFSRRQVVKPQYWLLSHRLEAEIQSLATYVIAAKEVQTDHIWGSHIDQMVGSPMSRHRLNLDGLLTSIPLFSLNKTNQYELSEQIFDYKVENLEHFFLAPTVNLVKATPLFGITLAERVSVSDCISIEPLTNDRLIELMDDGLVPDHFSSPTIDDVVWDVPRVAIFSKLPVPKLIGDGGTLEKHMQPLPDKLNRLNRDETVIVDLLALILGGEVRPLGSITKSDDLMSSARQTHKSEIANSWAIKKKPLEVDAQMKLLGLWPIFNEDAKKLRNFLVIAVRRYSQAVTRPSLDDKLIDLMICAEAIFLRTDHSELTYKLAHRAAMLLGNNSVQKKEIFKFFVDAYSMRSKVVHGAKSYTHDVKDAEQLSTVTAKLGDYLRRAILIMLDLALNPHATGDLIEWKDFMFPKESIGAD